MNPIRRIAGCSLCLCTLASAADLLSPAPTARAALENDAPSAAAPAVATERTADSPRASVITTFAGTDWIFQGDGKPALEAPLSQVEQMTVDSGGNVVGADPNNGIVFRLNRDGSLTVLAGNGIRGFSGDGGAAVNAMLSVPRGVAYDTAGNLFIADQGNHRIRRVARDGVISTFAGTGRAGNTGDQGPATQASLNAPDGVAVDSAGNVYILDSGNVRIRRVTRDGVIATFAGSGQGGFSRETGPATAFPLRPRRGLAADAAGNVYIADLDNNQIRKVTPEGEISTIAGTGSPGRSGDGGPATSAMLASPAGLALDTQGNLFIADLANHRIRRISTDGIITTVAGRGVREYSGDEGPAVDAGLSAPIGVAVDRAGTLFVADTGNYRVRKIDPSGIITTVAGNGSFRNAPSGTLAENAYLAQPQGLAFDPGGNLLVSDTANFRIRRILADRSVETIAGSGLQGCCAEGSPALEDLLTFPSFLVADPQGNIYFSDSTASRIRRLSNDGFITTYAGTGAFGYRDGPAREAVLGQPFGLALDGSGNLHFSDSANHLIRRVSPDGQVTTIAGNRQNGFSGDGPALNVSLNAPNGLAFDSAGNLLIADTLNHRIRILSPGGNLTTIAGTGVPTGPSGDGGPASQATLNAPIALVIDAAGNVFIAEFGGSRVRRISPDGVISTVAGTGQRGFAGDGKPATEAALSFPSDLAIDREGNLYIADAGNNRIRRVLASPPAFETPPASLSFSARAGGAPTTPQRFTILTSVTGVAYTATATTAAGGDWLTLTPAAGETPRLIEVAADPSTLQPGRYEGSLTISLPDATPPQQRFPVVFNVGAGLPPQISIDRKTLSFPLPRGASARSQTVTISNPGGGTLNFRTSVTTTSGGRWLSVSSASGDVVPAKPSILTVTANPQGLAPGAYSGTLSIAGAGAAPLAIPVHMLVSANDRALRLSQSGLTFTAVAGGGVVPPQSVAVLNLGAGVVSWSARAATLSGGSSWLLVSPDRGSSDASAATVPVIDVRIAPAGLSPGVYYGQIRVDAPGSANTPQLATVVLEILRPGQDPGASVVPNELIFTTPAGSPSPGSKDVLLYNLTADPKTYRSALSTESGGAWSINLPRDARLSATEPTRVVVQPLPGNLPAGVYLGNLAFQFSDGRVRNVRLVLIVTAVGQSAGPAAGLRAGEDCTPTSLVPALYSVGQSFNVSAGWPVPLVVSVTDNCGFPMDSGRVTATFSNGDPSVVLQSVKQGVWQGTWQTGRTIEAHVTVRIDAENPQQIRGVRTVGGELRSRQEPPLFDAGSITNSAFPSPYVPLAPGALITITGQRLAENQVRAQTNPLPTRLAGAVVLLAGRELPLLSVSETRIEALAPFGLEVNTSALLLVSRGETYSQPVEVNMASAQPAIFLEPRSRPAQGRIFASRAQIGAPFQFLAEPRTPAVAGDGLFIYCAGLGEVNGVSEAGVPGPTLPRARTRSDVRVTVGEVEAPVRLSALAPNQVGVYLVETVVPQGVRPGDDVPVTVRIEGQTSPTAMIAVR